ncbi:hypothetical protein FF36_05622 [Frankia torreyi]|uniref:Uncharacterized protein n=1 Tax=Frankia torreyi TaxID=1856 RepID=A0A0D8B706_9ACTN|nr:MULTISPECIES: hypothetical protein [Frankia]KJE20073.1 hypothetical protein FF36_05622 [Frankia torreyi]KQC39614.1 hypothetical protein UK82_02835 [Frankia sp. ACN1ag]KQM04127.1 hypothetical protein FF86_103051 [Frankia sp. CpI1-P]
MPKVTLRSRTMGGVAVLGLSALLAVAVPGTAHANTVGVTVKTPGATSGPGSTFAEISTHADCSSGLIAGGGINQAIGTGSVSNGNHVMGSEPSSDGSTEYTGTTGVVGTDVTHWLGIGGTGGATDASFSTTPYATCLTSNLVNHTQVVMNKASGPSAASTVNLVVATCPANTILLGGGARTTPASIGSLKPIASFPTFNDAAHDYGQKAAADGATNPNSWASVGWNGGGGGTSNVTYAYAICSGSGINVSGATVKVRYSEVSGPTSATTGQTATVGCGGGDGKLISGGAAISGGSVTTTDFTGPGSGGDHLNGSFPSTSGGSPVSDGTTTAAYWTAFSHTGGASSPSTYTDAWALCADDGV